jgi:hypothetical protein
MVVIFAGFMAYYTKLLTGMDKSLKMSDATKVANETANQSAAEVIKALEAQTRELKNHMDRNGR